MAKKSHCPRPVEAAACAVKAVHGCEAKRVALATLRQVLGAEASRGKVSSTAASKTYAKAAQGAASSCRMAERKRRGDRAIEADRQRIMGGGAVDGLLGLGGFLGFL